MLKPDNKKVSKQLLNYLKSTPSISESKPQPFKQKQVMIEHHQKHEGYYGPMEGDFSKIGQTYVLENDKLKKKSLFDIKVGANQMHNQKYEEIEEPQDVELVKEIAKLEYLQKKGYLKPEEIERLQKLKGNKFAPQFVETIQISDNNKLKVLEDKNNAPELMSFDIDPENIDPNMYYQHPYMLKQSQFSEPMHHHHFNNTMNYGHPMQYHQKAQYVGQGNSPMIYGHGMNPNHFDPRKTGYY